MTEKRVPFMQTAPFMVVWSGLRSDRTVEQDVEYVDATGALDATGKVLELRRQDGFISVKIVASLQIVHDSSWSEDEIDEVIGAHEREVAAAAEAAEQLRIEQQQIAEAEAASKAAARKSSKAAKR